MSNVAFDARVTLSPAGTAAAAAARPAAGASTGDFAASLKSALDGVNATQNQADDLARAFQTGDKDVGLEETMVAIAKANVSFQTLVQVRNRLVSAYHDIMNMQV
jgi:flagellar hook-basal body complex protein FliE